MSRNESVYVADMVEACARVVEYTMGLSAVALRGDRKTIDAVVRDLEVLGEAAKRVPVAVRSKAPAVPWRDISGMRDVQRLRRPKAKRMSYPTRVRTIVAADSASRSPAQKPRR